MSLDIDGGNLNYNHAKIYKLNPSKGLYNIRFYKFDTNTLTYEQTNVHANEPTEKRKLYKYVTKLSEQALLQSENVTHLTQLYACPSIPCNELICQKPVQCYRSSM